jgi:hypothetical protein
MPAPNANNTKVSDAAATPPAATAAHDTADWFSSRALARMSARKVSVMAAVPALLAS